MKCLIVFAVVMIGCNGQYLSSGLKSAPITQVREAYVPAPVPVQAYGPVEAAVQTRRTVEFRHVALPQEVAQPQIIEVNPNYESVLIHFKTASSPLTVRQSHIPAPVAPVEHTSYQDNAHRLVHEVTKPVIQEVREIIQPYRRITQEIRPVIEEVHTVVHKGERLAYQAPLPVKMAAPVYGVGAAAKGYAAAAKAAKAA